MTYLSRLTLDPSSREAVRLLASPRRIHGELASLPCAEATGDGRLLWRLDRRGAQTVLHVVTPGLPDLASLHARVGVQSVQPAILDLSAAVRGISAGQSLRFSLRANVIKHAVDYGTPRPDRPGVVRGKAVGLITEDEQRAWLDRQGERHGFTVEPSTLSLLRRPQERIEKRQPGGAHERTVTLSVVEFNGILTVQDPDAVRAGLVHGIGRAKAYGLGMLTVGPVRAHG